MGPTHPVIQDELAQLERVSELLNENPYETPPSEKTIVEQLVRLRQEMPNAKEEDRGSLMAQYDQQFALLNTLRASRDKPLVDPDSPYFAHVRLKEEGRARDVFLGKATRIDNGLRIVDWRNAPVSKIFYKYQQGEEYEEEIGHRFLEGTVLARRTVTIDRARLVRIDSPEGVFRDAGAGWEQTHKEPPRLAGGQGAAAIRVHDYETGLDRRLGTDLAGNRRRQDKRLPDIAGLIDAEQFDLITRPSSGFVVIRGTAGSGKTTVALHRIAYLAYEDPSFDSPSTVFMVFSRALKDYVSHVLPALGAPNAVVHSFPEWADGQRRRHFPKLPNKERHTTPGIVTRLKQHPAMLIVLKEQVDRLEGPANGEQAIDDWMSAISGYELLREVFHEHAKGAFTDDELRRVVDYTGDRNTELANWLEGDREIEATLDAEDAPLLLRAWQLRCGPLRGKNKAPLQYRHLAIDEVQDFSPTEVRVLLDCLDEKQSITLAGDTQQHVMQDSGFTSWMDFFQHLGVEGTAVNTLKVSYRSSAEVVQFAMKLLGPLLEDDEMPMVTRSGPPVELFRFTDHGAAVAFLADALKALLRAEPLASVILLTPDSTVSGTYYAGLRSGEVPSLRRVTNQDFLFEPGVEITELEQVKGLEFDYVILAEPSAAFFSDNSGARRLLHVGATRAVHQLWITCVGTPSPIIREALEGA